MRFIGLDVHREFCEVAIAEGGEVRLRGAVAFAWRRFCRIALDGRVPDPMTLMKLTKWFRSQVLSRGECVGGCGGVESFEEAVEVLASESPFERLGDLLVVAGEGEEPRFDGGEVGEVVGL